MEDRQELNRNLAQMLKGGVIMDVTTPEQAKIAEAAGACAVMELGAEGVFVGSGIFKSGDPAKRAAAIVQAVTNWQDAKLLAKLSEKLGPAMVGINVEEIETIMEERGK